MNFSDVVLEHLGSIFKNNNLLVVEQRSDYLKLESEVSTIIIVHNRLDNSNTLWIGKRGQISLVEIDNKLLELFFKSSLKLSQVQVQDFIKNLHKFFKSDGKSLFENTKILDDLEDFDTKRSQEYTENILLTQKLAIADVAWKNNDYNKFIKILNEIEFEVLSSSYKLKYKIATDKL